MLFLEMVEEEARDELEARYPGGSPALLPDAEEAWDGFAELVNGLWSTATALPGTTERGGKEEHADDPDDRLAGRAAERVRHPGDDARVRRSSGSVTCGGGTNDRAEPGRRVAPHSEKPCSTRTCQKSGRSRSARCTNGSWWVRGS